MTDLDSLPFHGDPGPPNLGTQAAKPRRCYRHRWVLQSDSLLIGAGAMWCPLCGAIRDPAKSRQARSSVRLGKDQERRIEATFGPEKVGEFGDAIDHLGRLWKWQAKASRSAPPLWLASIQAFAGRLTLPADWAATFTAMEPLRRDLRPLLIRSYVRPGVRTRDWIVVRSSDWAEEHGLPASSAPWLVMTGEEFLAVNGRDER